MTHLRKFFVLCLLFPLSVLGSLFAQHPALGGGTGTSADPYQIQTPAHLKQLADFVNAGNGNATTGVYYIVINDLDLSDYAAGEGWNPIGYFTSPTDYSYFQGNFDGNNKKVTNLKINCPADNQGLFGSINGATIENLDIENSNIVGKINVGGLVGHNYSSTISNCYAAGNVSGTGYYIGGLVGFIYFSTISNCYATGNVSGAGDTVGGLVGYNYSSTISNCYATGNVSGTESVGGLAGNNFISSTISNCYATGNVNGIGDVGGLVGQNSSSTISNCYAAGKVSGTGNNVGGLAGYNNSSTVSNCYAAGKVSGTGNYVGGLVGYNYNSTSFIIKNCVAANDSVVSTANTEYINRICGNTDGAFQNNYVLSTMVVQNSSGIVTISEDLNTNAGMSKSMVDFQSIAFYTTAGNWVDSAWDINDPNGIWKICDGESLPFLRWQGINCSNDAVVTIIATAEIQIYPNPVKDELRIKNDELRIKSVEILDLSGKTLLSQSSNLSQINVATLASGIYFVKITTDKGIVTRKFVKE